MKIKIINKRLLIKGPYKINAFQVTEDFLPAVMPPGEYLTEVKMVQNGATIFGYKMYATIT